MYWYLLLNPKSHARYTDRASEYSLGRKVRVIPVSNPLAGGMPEAIAIPIHKGRAVLVFELVRQHGMMMLGPILLLAGIGVLIVLSQVHVMLDGAPKPSGLDNLAGFPAAVAEIIPTLGGGQHLWQVC